MFDESAKAAIDLGDPEHKPAPGEEIASRSTPGRFRADSIDPALASLKTPNHLITLETAVIPGGHASAPETAGARLTHPVNPAFGRRLVFTTKPDAGSLTRDRDMLGEVTLPDGLRSEILLFLPSTTAGKTCCQVLVIDDSKRVFPAGSFRVARCG